MNRRRFLLVAGGAAGAGAAALVYGTLVEPRRVQFTRQRLPPGRGGRQPIGSLVQISDLHLKGIGGPHEAIAQAIARASPNAIVITGDSVDSPQAVPILEEFLSLLPYGIPKYAILGNWEHWGGVDAGRLGAVYERANCALLINRVVEHRAAAGTVRISGVDDLVGGSPDLEAVLTETGDADLHILLAHCPAHRDRIGPDRAAALDLVLSGHTHGGQVQIFGHAPFVPPGSGSYLEGWYAGSGPALYVSRGIGTSVLPIRFGARPEVTFFEGA